MTEEHEYWRAETVAFYALQSIHGVGFRTLYKIAAQGISFRELIKTEDPKHFEKMLKHKLPESVITSEEQWGSYKQELWSTGLELARKCASENIRVVFYGQDSFPKNLKQITEPPMWLFIQGALANLHTQSIAIVGSRKATEDGLWLTKFIVAAMAKKNLVSVSGLAEGIDQKAHTESMRFSVPTVAVLGTGIDSNYPRGSETVRAEILKNDGTIVSEYLIGQSYSAHNFVRRNRIQAGLATTVIPVEWRIKSGTAHTVNFAKEYDRYLVMPYLPDADVDSKELQAIRSYKKGAVFNIPEQSVELINFLQNPQEEKSPNVDLGDGGNGEQISLI